MTELLIPRFIEFNEESYYTKLDTSIDKILESYIDIRGNNSLDADSRAAAEKECTNRLTDIIFSSGMSDDDRLPFNFEQEFFTDGELNESKYKNFKNRVLQSKSSEELKWIFAGTSSLYSKVTGRELQKKNILLEDLLPAELRRKEKSEKLSKTETSPSSYSVYVYPDGSLSSEYYPAKAKFSFERTKDDSGVPWNSGYDLNLQIKKTGWDAGFNNDGTWESFTSAAQGTGIVSGEAKTKNPLICFDTQLHDSPDYVYVLPVGMDEGIVGDSEGLLINEQDEQYFSVTGQLYASRKADTKATIAKLKKEIDKTGIKKISTVIVPDTSKKTISAYKKIFGKRITPETAFSTTADPSLHKEIANLRESMAGSQASVEILRRYGVLQAKGLSGKNLYSNLEHETVKPVIESKLAIFNSIADLETFVTLPAVSDVIDGDTLAYINSLEIPEDKTMPMSMAVQNLLYNYRELFQHSDTTPKEVLSIIHETIVKGNTEKASRIRITGESTLADFIEQQTPGVKKTTVPVFHSVKDKNEIPDLFSETGFAEWEKTAPSFLNSEMNLQVKAVLQSVAINESEQKEISLTVISALKEFDQVRESTGITPAEFTAEIIAVSKGLATGLPVKKRVLFNKSLDSLINEASTGTKLTLDIPKKDIFTSVIQKARVENVTHDSTDDRKILNFAEEHLNPADREKIVKIVGTSLSDEQIDTLIDQYSNVFSIKSSAVLRRVEPDFQHVNVEPSDISNESITPVFTDTGWKISSKKPVSDADEKSQHIEVKFTNKGIKKIQPAARIMIQSLAASSHGTGINFENLIKVFSDRGSEGLNKQVSSVNLFRNINYGSQSENSNNDLINIEYQAEVGTEDTFSSISTTIDTQLNQDQVLQTNPGQKRNVARSGKKQQALSDGIDDMHVSPERHSPLNQVHKTGDLAADPETFRMQQFNENYNADKAMLAKSGIKGISSDGGSGAIHGAQDGNKIKKASEELFEEFIDKITGE